MLSELIPQPLINSCYVIISFILFINVFFYERLHPQNPSPLLIRFATAIFCVGVFNNVVSVVLHPTFEIPIGSLLIMTSIFLVVLKDKIGLIGTFKKLIEKGSNHA